VRTGEPPVPRLIASDFPRLLRFLLPGDRKASRMAFSVGICGKKWG
jgi:hypothetical protein